MTKNRQFLGIMCALCANLIFGFSFIFSKLALNVSQPLIILSVRFSVAFIFLNILWLLGAFKINLKAKQKTKLILMAIAQPLLYFIFELYGLSLVSSALSGVIIALVPVAVMIFSSLFLHEKPTLIQAIFTLLSIVGVSAISIISNDGSKNHFLGIILLIGAVICASIFNILSRSEAETFTPFERTYIMFLVGSVGFNLIAIFNFKAKFIPLVFEAVTNKTFIISIIYLAIISSVLAFLLYNFSTSNISVVQSSSFSNIITVVTVLAGVLILKEFLTALQYILCGIIILGVWGVNFFAPKRKNNFFEKNT